MDHDLTKSELRGILTDRDALAGEDFFFLTLHLKESSPLKLEEAAVRVLLILSGRTMRRLPYETAELRSRSNGHVIVRDEKAGVVDIALPRALCSTAEGITHLFSLICSAAEYSYCDEYWVDNIEFPRSFANSFKGPRFGVSGTRDLFGPTAARRPLVGVMFKPRSGVPLEIIAPYLKDALLGGCDFIADDLLLVDREGEASFEHRVKYLSDMAKSVQRHMGVFKGYFVNIGTSPMRAVRLARCAIASKATGLIVNGFAMGFGSMAEVIDELDGAVPVLSCNMGGGILTRPRLFGAPGKPTGISETVVSKLSRLAGADGVHAGTSASECYGTDAWGPATRALKSSFFGLKPSFAVAEGDLNIANLWENIKSLGPDVLLEPTTGILSAPSGPKAAANVFRHLSERLARQEDMTDEEAALEISRFAHEKGHWRVAEMLDHYGYRIGVA